jgi:hypothetical protein
VGSDFVLRFKHLKPFIRQVVPIAASGSVIADRQILVIPRPELEKAMSLLDNFL